MLVSLLFHVTLDKTATCGHFDMCNWPLPSAASLGFASPRRTAEWHSAGRGMALCRMDIELD